MRLVVVAGSGREIGPRQDSSVGEHGSHPIDPGEVFGGQANAVGEEVAQVAFADVQPPRGRGDISGSGAGVGGEQRGRFAQEFVSLRVAGCGGRTPVDEKPGEHFTGCAGGEVGQLTGDAVSGLTPERPEGHDPVDEFTGGPAEKVPGPAGVEPGPDARRPWFAHVVQGAGTWPHDHELAAMTERRAQDQRGAVVRFVEHRLPTTTIVDRRDADLGEPRSQVRGNLDGLLIHTHDITVDGPCAAVRAETSKPQGQPR